MKNNIYVIAEIGVNHNGSYSLAKKMIIESKKSGADAVKFQTYKAENISDQLVKKANYQRINSINESQFEMLKKYELTNQDFQKLKNYSNEINIDFISTAVDTESLNFLVNNIKLKTIKIGSSDLTNIQLLLLAGKTNKKIILSTGMSTEYEIDIALSALCYGNIKKNLKFDITKHKEFYRNYTNYLVKKITLLHCTTEYPAPYNELNLNVLDSLKKKYTVKIGYSDHSNHILTPIILASKNVTIIEVHVTKNKRYDGPDHKSSLNFKELKQYIKNIRLTEKMLGSYKKIIVPSERKNIKLVRKNLVFKSKIDKGERILETHLTSKRTVSGISAINFSKVIGKRVKKSFDKNSVVELKYLEKNK